MTGNDEGGSARGAAGAAVAAHGHAIAGDHKRIPDGNGFAAAGNERRRNPRGQRFGKLDQGNVGGCEVVKQPLYVKLRMAFNANDGLEDGRLSWRAADQLVIGAWPRNAPQSVKRRGRSPLRCKPCRMSRES